MAIAGCTESGANEAPEAALELTRDSAFAGEEMTFDAQGSQDPDGEIARWVFDFGDGTTMEVDAEDDARVKHAYAEGGVYDVTLTVFDDGKDGAGALSDTTGTKAVVHESTSFAGEALYAVPLQNQSRAADVEFDVKPEATDFEIDLELSSAIPAGASEIRVRLIAPDGAALLDEVVSVPAGGMQSFAYDGALEDAGNHTLRLTAESGAVIADGQIRVYYAGE
jgi:hypothetical protein